MNEGSSLVVLSADARRRGEYTRSSSLLLEAAQLGNSQAMWMLARAYEFGELGLTVSPDRSMQWYEQACALDYGPALADLSFIRRRDGREVEAAALGERAFKSGDAFAVAQCYAYGLGGLLQNDDLAVEGYTRSADRGSTYGTLKLGSLYYRRGDFIRARPFLLEAARAGHAEAQFLYAMLLLRGINCDPAPYEALLWLRNCAQQGRPKAVGCCAELLLNSVMIADCGREGALWLLTGCSLTPSVGQSMLRKRLEIRSTLKLCADERLKELFVYGRFFSKDKSIRLPGCEGAVKGAVEIYQESQERARAATTAFIGLCRFRRTPITSPLNKDTLLLIGHMIHTTAAYPGEWGVSLSDKGRAAVTNGESGAP